MQIHQSASGEGRDYSMMRPHGKPGQSAHGISIGAGLVDVSSWALGRAPTIGPGEATGLATDICKCNTYVLSVHVRWHEISHLSVRCWWHDRCR